MERYIREGSFKKDLSLLDTLKATLDSLEILKDSGMLEDFTDQELKVYKDTVTDVKAKIKTLEK